MELVSAVMPTANRRHLVPQAIDSFLSQTWPCKELWILDDGEDWAEDLIPYGQGVDYVRTHPRLNIPKKRNLVNSMARGGIIINWDDDDWSAPERMEQQVRFLEESGRDLVGYDSLAFWDVETEIAYWYKGVRGAYACGTTFCYRKRFWEENPYDETKDLSTDNVFCQAACRADQLATVSAEMMMVARVHIGNSSPKHLGAENFSKMPASDLNRSFPRCLELVG